MVSELRVDVKELETKNYKKVPTKKGTSLPLRHWKLLVDNLDFLDQAVEEKELFYTPREKRVR